MQKNSSNGEPQVYQICTRCIMDTSEPEIVFDDQGVCNHCMAALKRMQTQLLPASEREKALAALVELIRSEGKGKDYDCIIGVSGGVDSTMTAWKVQQIGLRPLAVHFDNGWNSELAVSNIKNTLDKLKIDLYTHVVDWEEFRDLQLCFLRASLANCEAPTDHGITALLFKMAAKERTRFILSGSNLVTEAIMPISWGHYNQDLRLMKALHRRFGSTRLRTMPTISLAQYFYYVFVKNIRQIPFLNYIDYDKNKAKGLLAGKLGWRDYGGKHYESVWTRFFQGYYLPVKFGFDKRVAHLSTMICSNQITRKDALAEMKKPTYDETLLKQDMAFVIKKFGLTEGEFLSILQQPNKSATDYPSHHFLFHTLMKYKNIFRKIATSPK
jgi:N-acetyl sugar amidotransferase